jgi:hypothetical protein
MKLYSFSLFGAVIALSFGAAGLHFKSVKPLAVSTSQPAAIAMPQAQAGGTASLNLNTMKITPATTPTGFVERTAGGSINPLNQPLQSNPNPPAVPAQPQHEALTGTN